MAEYYRVDRRRFSVGERIFTADEYYAEFSEIARVIEDGLNAARPSHMPLRARCLFLFEDLGAAKKHWSKMKDGKLYKVEAEPLDFIHRGDMALMDLMKERAEAGLDWQGTAATYWSGETSAVPEIEVLVKSAVVVEIISESDEERLKHLLWRWGLQNK